MNILILTSEYPFVQDKNPDRTRVVGYFARAWARQGHRVAAVVDSSAFPSALDRLGRMAGRLLTRLYPVSQMPDGLWARRFSFFDQGVQVENLPMQKRLPHGRFSKRQLERQIADIESLLDRQGFVPDVVVGHWVNPQIMLAPALAKRYGARSAFVFHGDWKKRICRKFRVQTYLNQIDHVGFRSPSARAAAKEYLRFREEPFIAASGVPEDWITKEDRAFDGAALRLLSAARLVKGKQIGAIADACAAAFRDIPFTWTVAGEGPERPALEKRIKKRGISPCVRLLGQIPREELRGLMRGSDVFALISEGETFGLVYLEAMAQGCIPVASRGGGADGIIREGENGFLCRAGDAEELSAVLRRIAALPPEEKRRISRAAVETAREYTEDKAAKRYLDWASR